MLRVLRIILTMMMIACMATATLAQSKEARDKYNKALKELDWRERIGGAGRAGMVYKAVTPPNAEKADRLFREAAALSPEWPQPWYALGDLNYVMKKFTAAAENYSKAKGVDDKSHQLDKEMRLDMLDQLGLSLAMARKLDEAKASYMTSLQEHPDYPLFEYNLSCVLAEQENLDDALAYLKKAWEHKGAMPEGVPFPDPRTDSSFKKYWDDPSFKDAVREMVI